MRVHAGLSDCSAHVLLATGRIDALSNPACTVDIARRHRGDRGRRGRWSDFDGMDDPACTAAIVSNDHLHERLLSLIEHP